MPETSIEPPPGNELPNAEQVRYLQALWDQISEHPDEISVPESHLQLAEEAFAALSRESFSRKTRVGSNRPPLSAI